MRHEAGAGCGMWSMNHRRGGKIRRGGGVLRSTGEGGEHVWGRNRAGVLLVWGAGSVGDIRNKLRLRSVRPVVHQVWGT